MNNDQLSFSFSNIAYSEVDAESNLTFQTSVDGDPSNGNQGGGSVPGDPLFPYGYVSCPADPGTGPDGVVNAGQACGALVVDYGDTRRVLPLGDPRKIPKLPAIRKGEVMVYGPTGSFERWHADGTISQLTSADVDDGTEQTSAVVNDPAAGWSLKNPYGSIKLDATGFHVNVEGGGELHLGFSGGLPGPLSPLASNFAVIANQAEIDASAVAFGMEALDNGVLATPLIAILSGALLTWMTSVQAALTSTATIVGQLTPAAIPPPGVAQTAAGVIGATTALFPEVADAFSLLGLQVIKSSQNTA